MLAHKATQANAAEITPARNVGLPGCDSAVCFTDPEIVSVGQTPDEVAQMVKRLS